MSGMQSESSVFIRGYYGIYGGGGGLFKKPRSGSGSPSIMEMSSSSLSSSSSSSSDENSRSSLREYVSEEGDGDRGSLEEEAEAGMSRRRVGNAVGMDIDGGGEVVVPAGGAGGMIWIAGFRMRRARKNDMPIV